MVENRSQWTQCRFRKKLMPLPFTFVLSGQINRFMDKTARDKRAQRQKGAETKGRIDIRAQRQKGASTITNRWKLNKFEVILKDEYILSRNLFDVLIRVTNN